MAQQRAEEHPGAGGPGPRLPARVVAQVWGERAGVVLIVAGLLGLIQPWVQDFYTDGFTVLLAGTIIFIICSHL